MLTVIRRSSRLKLAAGLVAVALTAVGIAGPKTAGAAQPDLTVDRITHSAGKVNVRMHNATAATGGAFYVSLRQCNTMTCTYHYFIQSAMNANQDALKSVPAIAGLKSAYACVDVYWPTNFKVIAESNEGNNCESNTF